MPQTRWTLIRRVQRRDEIGSHRSGRSDPANELCALYIQPMYAHVRRSGLGPEDAQDCVQSFWAKMFRLGSLGRVREQGTRFRSFLLTSLDRHRLSLRRASRTAKRGGGTRPVSLESGSDTPAMPGFGVDHLPPDRQHDLAVAEAMVRAALERLRRHYADKGKLAHFEGLVPVLEGPMPHRTYAGLARDLGVSEGALRVGAVRFQERFQRAVREVAAQAWSMAPGPALERELRQLFRSVG